MLFNNWLITFIIIYLMDVDGQSSNYEVSYIKLYLEEYKKWGTIEAESHYSCFVHDLSSEEPFQLAIICPTDVNCYLITFLRHNYDKSSHNNYNIHLDAPCETKEPLPDKKREQLSGVHEVLRLIEETMCAFSPVETLDVRFSALNNMGRVGGGSNCHLVSQCPYRLKYLNFDQINIGDVLVNNSFCQFPRLEFLGLMNGGVRAIEADAFVYLLRLKELMLYGNHLTDLPPDLFGNNTQLETVNLRNNKLKMHALNPLLTVNSLHNLYLTENHVTFDENQLAFPANLRELFINKNSLTRLGWEFSNLPNLTHLILWENAISQIDENAFKNQSEVKFIDLRDNKIEQLHRNTFKDTLKLEILILSVNKLIDFPSIAHLQNLKEVYLNYNRIKSIDRSHFNNCSQLSHLDLSYNELISIENGSLDNVRQLRRLILSHNRLSQLTVYLQNANVLEINLDFNRFTQFSYENFSSSVRKLSMAHNEIETIAYFDDFTPDGKEWNLTRLTLNNNKIRQQLNLPVSIQEVNLSNNRLNETLTIADVVKRGLINLRSVDARGNNISLLCKHDFAYKTDLRITYHISGNPLRCSCENYWLKYPQTTDTFTFADLNDLTCRSTNPYKPHAVENVLQLNDINFLCRSNHAKSNRCECPAIDDILCTLPCPTNCTCVSNFYQSAIGFMCNSRSFKEIPNVDLKYNGKYYANSDENVLDLSDNYISHIETIDFENNYSTSKVSTLYLQNSGVKSIQRNAFDKLIGLQILNLAKNQLRALPDQLFRKLTQLTYLDLSHNRLTQLADDTFASQANLRYLYLRNNNLSRISLKQITQLKHLRNTTLDDNPWSCDCTFIEAFRAFLVDSLTPVNNKLELNCTENGEQFNISNFNLEKCLTQIYLTVLIVSLTFGTIIAITAGLVFKWRYELRVLVYARYGMRVFRQRQPEEEVDLKQYDAFVAYNSKDTDFLINDLMPGLEAIANPYRLCIHERDFPAGSYIQDSIVNAISMSSRTIIVLSENFVSSGWCRFEFKSAHMQMLQDRCPRILVIVLGEVPGSLDPEMKLYLKTNTYLQWGERLFWQKLYYAMPDQRVTTPPTDIMPLRHL